MIFMFAMACLTCLTFGLIPAWRASRVATIDVTKANIRSGANGPEGMRLRRLLVVVQIACSLVLLFGGLLFTGTLRNLLAVDTGFQSRDVAVARVNFSGMAISPANRRPLTDLVVEKIRQAPGIISAAEVRHVPFGGTGTTMIAQRDVTGATDPGGRSRDWRSGVACDGRLRAGTAVRAGTTRHRPRRPRLSAVGGDGHWRQPSAGTPGRKAFTAYGVA